MFKALHLCIVVGIVLCATSTSAFPSSEPTQLESPNASEYSLGKFYNMPLKSCDQKISLPHFKVFSIESTVPPIVPLKQNRTLRIKGQFSQPFPRNKRGNKFGRIQVLTKSPHVKWTPTDPEYHYYKLCKNSECLLGDKEQTLEVTVLPDTLSLVGREATMRVKVSDFGDDGKETIWSCTEFPIHFLIKSKDVMSSGNFGGRHIEGND
eukprot:Nk52_evm32s230 gene=Nk52_evmTU32s230